MKDENKEFLKIKDSAMKDAILLLSEITLVESAYSEKRARKALSIAEQFAQKVYKLFSALTILDELEKEDKFKILGEIDPHLLADYINIKLVQAHGRPVGTPSKGDDDDE